MDNRKLVSRPCLLLTDIYPFFGSSKVPIVQNVIIMIYQNTLNGKASIDSNLDQIYYSYHSHHRCAEFINGEFVRSLSAKHYLFHIIKIKKVIFPENIPNEFVLRKILRSTYDANYDFSRMMQIQKSPQKGTAREYIPMCDNPKGSDNPKGYNYPKSCGKPIHRKKGKKKTLWISPTIPSKTTRPTYRTPDYHYRDDDPYEF